MQGKMNTNQEAISSAPTRVSTTQRWSSKSCWWLGKLEPAGENVKGSSQFEIALAVSYKVNTHLT